MYSSMLHNYHQQNLEDKHFQCTWSFKKGNLKLSVFSNRTYLNASHLAGLIYLEPLLTNGNIVTSNPHEIIATTANFHFVPKKICVRQAYAIINHHQIPCWPTFGCGKNPHCKPFRAIKHMRSKENVMFEVTVTH